MAANKILSIPPVVVPTSVGNILNCAITSVSGPVGFTPTQPYLIVKHIRVNNSTGAAISCTLYKGATGASAAGTQFGFNAASIPANGSLDFYTQQAFESTDFLTGIAGATGLNVDIAAEIGFR